MGEQHVGTHHASEQQDDACGEDPHDTLFAAVALQDLFVGLLTILVRHDFLSNADRHRKGRPCRKGNAARVICAIPSKI
jgi:hypothetical protein